MTQVFLAPGPFGAGGQFFGLGGLPLNAGTISTYAAGGTTPLATYTSSAGIAQNANPIPLGPDGRPPNEIWITSAAYRFDLKDALGNLIKTYDNLGGFVDSASLAASTGSSLVGWIRAAASAVATTVSAWFSWQSVHVFEFMTIAQIADVQSGTPTIDLTTQFAAALAAVPANGSLKFSDGVYLGTLSVRRNNISIIGNGSASTTIRHPVKTITNVLELGDTASGNSATAYSGIVVHGVMLDGNRANVAAPTSDLVGHGLPMTKISKYHISDVRMVNCHNAGFGAFIDSNHGFADVYVENCGNATYTGPGFDINSSKYSVFHFVSKDCYSGGRVLDNCYGNVVRGSVKNATSVGFTANNQLVNESFLNDIDVTVDTTGSNGFVLGGGFKNSAIRASIKNAGDVGFNTTLYAAVTKTFDGSSAVIVDTATDRITVAAHGFVAGQPIVYGTGGGTAITGLTGGETYYAIIVDANTLRLGSTLANAQANIAVDLTAVGVGVSHTFIFEQGARGNTIIVNTYRSANQGVYMGGNNNDWTINTDRDGRGGAVGANFAVDVNGNYNTISVNHHDETPWKVRGIAVRAGATGNRFVSYQWDNTLDPWNDLGTSTIGPNGRAYHPKGFSLTRQGGHILTRTAPTYGASVAIDASFGNEFDITATNGTAFTVANPTNATDGQRITITVRNGSGGVLGAITWDTLYKMSAWTSPANGFSRSVDFKYNGTNWVQVAQTGVDVPN